MDRIEFLRKEAKAAKKADRKSKKSNNKIFSTHADNFFISNELQAHQLAAASFRENQFVQNHEMSFGGDPSSSLKNNNNINIKQEQSLRGHNGIVLAPNAFDDEHLSLADKNNKNMKNVRRSIIVGQETEFLPPTMIERYPMFSTVAPAPHGLINNGPEDSQWMEDPALPFSPAPIGGSSLSIVPSSSLAPGPHHQSSSSAFPSFLAPVHYQSSSLNQIPFPSLAPAVPHSSSSFPSSSAFQPPPPPASAAAAATNHNNLIESNLIDTSFPPPSTDPDLSSFLKMMSGFIVETRNHMTETNERFLQLAKTQINNNSHNHHQPSSSSPFSSYPSSPILQPPPPAKVHFPPPNSKHHPPAPEAQPPIIPQSQNVQSQNEDEEFYEFLQYDLSLAFLQQLEQLKGSHS
jgi:hypothetical protein